MTEKQIEKLESENRQLRDQFRLTQSQFEDKIAELSMIREIGSTLLHARDFERVCETILDVIITHTIAQNCSIMLLDPVEKKLFLVAATDAEKNRFFLESRRISSREGLKYLFKPGEGAAGRALQTQKSVLISEAKNTPLFSEEMESGVEIGSLISVPLIVENEVIGVLNLSHAHTNIFETNDINLFNIIANYVAISLHSALNYKQLQYSEEMYKVLAENTHDGIAVIQDGLHVYVNPKYQELTVYKQEDLKEITFVSLLSDFEAMDQNSPIRSLLRYESDHEIFENKIIRKNGEIAEVEINGSQISYNDKNAVILSVRDLRDRKILEKQLQQAKRLEAIGTLAGGVAHDLNNILSGLVSYPDLLLMEIKEGDPLRKPLLTIKKSGEKAATIVNDLLTLARGGIIGLEAVALNGIINDYLKSPEFEKLAYYHPEVRVETDLSEDLFNILGSPAHLSKNLMNLVSNAAEAMPNGGVIHISTRNRTIDQAFHGYEIIPEGDYVLLRVSDRGTGISQKDLERIFEPFYTKKVMGRSGSGLGMAVVWGTVKDHKGYIDIQTFEGEGTTFSIYFPVTRKELSKEGLKYHIDDYKGDGESLLVIDDMEEQREIVSMLLTKLGYSAVTVSSGEKAVEYMKKNSADLLILDMIMPPGMDGLETYRQILEIHPGQKAIIASGFSETERVKKALRLGAGQYIKKPYTLENIGLAIKKELDK